MLALIKNSEKVIICHSFQDEFGEYIHSHGRIQACFGFHIQVLKITLLQDHCALTFASQK